ncbi:MAG: hypothetical protein JWQ23_1023 [Herminiimonas sp.]|nr:hypothetical protein [Herminiimonas sp.]
MIHSFLRFFVYFMNPLRSLFITGQSLRLDESVPIQVEASWPGRPVDRASA